MINDKECVFNLPQNWILHHAKWQTWSVSDYYCGKNEIRSSRVRKLTEKWTPLDLQKAFNLSCLHAGWHSDWLTAGVTRAYSSNSPNFLVEKLLTPIALALPLLFKASIAFQVLGMSDGTMFSALKPTEPFFIRIGQWILIGKLISI